MERSAFTRDLFTHNRGADVSGEAEHIAGACLLARREALEGIGLFDERFRYWFEDCDLCYRLRKAGWDLIYLREAQVVHYSSASLGKLTRLERDTMCFTSMPSSNNTGQRPRHSDGPVLGTARSLSA